jgi:hypothetical protein
MIGLVPLGQSVVAVGVQSARAGVDGSGGTAATTRLISTNAAQNARPLNVQRSRMPGLLRMPENTVTY